MKKQISKITINRIDKKWTVKIEGRTWEVNYDTKITTKKLVKRFTELMKDL